MLSLFCVAVRADNITWTGSSGTDFEGAGNWTGTTTPPTDDLSTDIALFTAVTGSKPALTKSRSIGGLRFQQTGDMRLDGAFVLSVGTNGVDFSGASGTVTLDATVGVVTDQIWTVDSGKIDVNVLTGSKVLTKEGEGTLEFLSDNPSWNGDLIVRQGILIIPINPETSTGRPIFVETNGTCPRHPRQGITTTNFDNDFQQRAK